MTVPNPLSRRSFLGRLLILPLAGVLASCQRTLGELLSGGSEQAAATAEPVVALAPTPACDDDDDDVTISQTEGPYYTPNSPERTSLLEDGIDGTRLLVTGYVLSTDCTAIPQALIDFWHCDADGNYDNVGYRLRGHQYTDANGMYTLETILPGLYPGRTRHIHVKVQAPNQPILTTQLYFSGEAQNASDGIYDPALEMTLQDTADGQQGTFNFVLAV